MRPVSVPVGRRNVLVDHAAGAECSLEGIDRMETALLSNGAKLDQKGEAPSRMRSSNTRDLEDFAIFQSDRSEFPAPHAATVDCQQIWFDVQS